MTSSNANIGVVIEARDRASAQMTKVQGVMKGLQAQALSTAKSMFSMSAIMGPLGLSTAAIVGGMTGMVKGVLDTQKAASALQGRMLLLGLSTDRADLSMRDYINTLNRASMQAIAGLEDETLKYFMLLDTDVRDSLIENAKKWSEATGGAVTFEQALHALTEAFGDNMQPMADLGINAENYADGVNQINEAHQKVMDDQTPLQKAIRELKENWGKLKEAMGPVAQVLLAGVTDGIKQFTKMLGGDIGALLQGPTKVIEEAIQGALKAAWDLAWGALSGSVGEKVEALFTALKEQWEKVKTWWTDTAMGALQNAWATAWSTLANLAKGVVGWVWGGLKAAWRELADWWKDSALQRFVDELAKLPAKAWQIGQNIVGSLWNGIQSRLPGLPSFITDIFGGGPAPAVAMPTRNTSSAPTSPAMVTQAPLVVNVGDERLTELVIEVVNGQIRVTEPSLSLG